MGRPRRPKRSRKAGFPKSGNARKPRKRPTESGSAPKAPTPPRECLPVEPSTGLVNIDEHMHEILKRWLRPSRTYLSSESRSDVLGERHFTRTYMLPSGRKVRVKTVMEMENGCPRISSKAAPSPKA